MVFIDKYPNLFTLFAGYFHDADFDNLTDESIVRGYRADCSITDIEQTIQELDLLLIDSTHCQSAANEANRYFFTNQDLLTWLIMIRKELSRQV